MNLEANIVNTDIPCHICGNEQIQQFTDYPALPRVASDCVPWRSGGRLATCSVCKCVQNPVDPDWERETMEVYSKYKLYRQGSGSEQGVFSENNPVLPRSAKVFEQAKPFLDLKNTGRLLDIGCANGELLRCFHKIAPDWKLVGFEIDDKRKDEVESIEGVEKFASGSLDNLEGNFDIITLIHVFEHLPQPVQWLENLKRLLTQDGIVIIQVPDPKTNPYNLLVADHCSHFLMENLIDIAQRANYEVITSSDSWVKRELSILIKPTAKPNQSKTNPVEQQVPATIYPQKSLMWLSDIQNQVKSFPKDKINGIWGTAIAATWVFSLLDEKIQFFIDEDLTRVGKTHLGKPVYRPEDIPDESNVFIALTPEIAKKISTRWSSKLGATLHSPPDLKY